MVNEVLHGIKDFLLGGKAEFTLVQEGEKEVSMKYRLVGNDNKSCFFVYSEGNATAKLLYQGYITVRKMEFHRAKNIADSDYNEKAIKALNWLFAHCNNLPSVVHVIHHGKCARCGRKLTDLESIQTGLGPICRSKTLL